MHKLTKAQQIELHDKLEADRNSDLGSILRQVILGGQDGLVNVLGVILGVASATQNTGIVIVAGLAATFAESVSMAAVAYTSQMAAKDFYKAEMKREIREIEQVPEVEKEEIRMIYRNKGFKGKLLEEIVKTITSDKKRWLKVMMQEELGLIEAERVNPVSEGFVVGLSAIIGSLIPLAPFFFLPVGQAMWAAVTISALTLFIAGAVKAHLTTGAVGRSGLEMAVIGTVAAMVGYAVGVLSGAHFLG